MLYYALEAQWDVLERSLAKGQIFGGGNICPFARASQALFGKGAASCPVAVVWNAEGGKRTNP
jgi:nitrite reductase/ring-hydroxylating ferredoxin subunit